MRRLCAAALFGLMSCWVSLHLGQDANFDLRAYHVYGPWALLTGRWSQDLLAAGAQTFFCPFLDVPYYLVAAALFPSHGAFVVALAGLPYGVLLYFIYLIAERIGQCLDLSKRDRVAFCIASVLLAGTGAATWPAVGSTFNDIPVAAIVLAAFHQILIAVTGREEERPARRFALAGALLGLATGLKLTAAIYVPSMAIVVLAVERDWQSRMRSLAIYGCCVSAAFIAIYGPWGWKLYHLTGNPFFPLFNGLFRSDWMPSISFRDERFFPRSPMQWLFFPFYWLTVQQWVVTELPFRDARMAAAYFCMAAYALIAVTRRDVRRELWLGKYRAVNAMALFVASSYVVWIREFSILRYLVATECLAGVFIITAVVVAARAWRGATWAPALGAISICGAIIGYTVTPPWDRVPAGTDIFGVTAPPFERGSLVIFADSDMSYLAPGLAARNQDVRFMTIPRWFGNGKKVGAEGFDHKLERQMKAMIATSSAPLYVLFNRPAIPPEPNMWAFDVRMDMASCKPGRSSLGFEFLACRAIYAGG